MKVNSLLSIIFTSVLHGLLDVNLKVEHLAPLASFC